MKKLETTREVNLLALLFAVTYMISYMTRINYGTIISEIAADTQTAKSLLSMALTGSFITYGTGQIISGICGDRFSPKKLVAYGLIVSVAMNLLIPLCTNPYQMLAVWSVNGFAQAFMWPPMVRMMTALLSAEDYKDVTVKVSWGSSCGTIAMYLLSPLIISLFGWRWVFVFSAACGVIMLLVWQKYAHDVSTERTQKSHNGTARHANTQLFTPLMFGVMFAIIMQGMLRDGVTTWMPSYISETYNLSNVISILTGVVMPIFSILSFQVSAQLYRKRFKNPMLCAGVFFGAGAAAAAALFGLTGQNAIFSVVLSALLTGCMHGVNLILIGMIPSFFEKYGNVSTASGVLNSCTYIGSAISTYGVAALSENIGWSYTLLVWLLIAVLGTVSCLVCTRPWQKRFGTEDDET